MSHTILVPIDISETNLTNQVIPHVEAQAKIDDAKVHFLTVIPSVPYYAALGLAYSAELPDKDNLKGDALAKLNEIVKQFNLPDDRTETHVIYGSPKDQILKFADDVHADLLIIASHRPDITTYLLGSNASAVVRHAKCPVLVVR